MKKLNRAFFSSEGRMSRLPYLGYSILNGGLYLLASLVFGAVLGLIGGVMAGASGGNGAVAGRIWGEFAAIPAGLLTLWVGYNLAAKRLHDMDWSGGHAIWFTLLAAISGVFQQVGMGMMLTRDAHDAGTVVAGLGFFLILPVFVLSMFLLFKRGTPGPNKHGEQPIKGGPLPQAA